MSFNYRYRLYAGKGRKMPYPMKEKHFIAEFDAIPVARTEAWRQNEKGKDWWAIFDNETGDFHSTWSTGRTAPHLRGK